jgi:iron complex outermembrane recepter protein
MRIARSTLIGTAVAMALFGRQGVVHAQTSSNATPSNASDLQEVVVTGIRFALEQSIEAKRDANNFVDVVTAEDIGKMPDKNIADALQRVPGLTISSAGANEGGFDEADRVSMRGTNPSLTQTLINGHAVASADWFVLNQTGTVGRSVSYTLLPSELVSQVVVDKSSKASLVEGGVAGSVDIITRKPLDFHKSNTIEVSAGAVYADLPGTTDPQFSALGNWINDAHNLGVLVQLFSETRHLRRDGQELLGYEAIQAGSPMALAHPDLSGVQYPVLIGSAFFQQERQRNGGLIDVEWQPSDAVTLDASGFSSKLEATNVNYNYLFWGTHVLGAGNGQAPNPGYVVQNGTLTSATFAPVAGTAYGVYDQIARPDESASSNFGNLDVHVRASDALSFLGQYGVSTGHGRTPNQDVLETNPGVGSGAAYQLNGTTTAANWNLGNTVNTTPTPGGVPVAFGWIFGDQNLDVLDREMWIKLDGDYTVHTGAFTGFKFGARYTDHDRHLWGAIGQGPGCMGEPCPPNTPPANSPTNPANYPTGFQNYPSNFGYGLGQGFPANIWYFTPGQLAAYNFTYTNRDPVTRADWSSDYGLDEKDTAGYVQADFAGTNWSGNVGLRFVQTKESVLTNVAATANTPGAITTSAFGPYVTVQTDNTYNDVLPSANLKLDLTKDLVARFAAAQTMTRPDYSALAGSIALGAPPPPPQPGQTPQTGSGSGSNPDLKPIKSTNLDAGLEWYFAPGALLSATAFYMDLKDYVSYGTVTKYFESFTAQNPNGYLAPYLLTVPVNADGRVYGAEFNYIQPFSRNWGIQTNYTYADGKQTSQVTINGDDRLVGTSKNTFNVIGYYENPHFSARVAYNYRSEFFSGLDRNTAFSQNGIGTLAASLGYIINDNFSVTLDGLNLNNPTLKYFAVNNDQPRAFYKNGSQYYLTLRMKL